MDRPGGRLQVTVSAEEALARFEFNRLERESDLRVADGPMTWERAELGLRKEMLDWAGDALRAVRAAAPEPLDFDEELRRLKAGKPVKPVAGYCPMGCGETLFLGSGGAITCSYMECPAPDAVHRILADPEHEHIARFDQAGFSLQHPLRERLDGALFDCRLHGEMRDFAEMPVPEEGTYRVLEHPNAPPTFTRLK